MQLKDFFKRKAPWPIKLLRTAFILVPLASLGLHWWASSLPDDGFSDKMSHNLKEIFADSVNFDDVNFNQSPEGDLYLGLHSTHGVAIGNTIILSSALQPNTTTYDYTIIHEAAHVWQSQNCYFKSLRELYEEASYGFHLFSPVEERYKYRLEADKDLFKYNHEAQASIIADYFYYVQKGIKPFWLQNKNLSDDETKLLYEAVLRKFLDDPNYTKQECNLGLNI